MEGAVPKQEGGALPRPLAWMEKFALKRMRLKQFCVDEHMVCLSSHNLQNLSIFTNKKKGFFLKKNLHVTIGDFKNQNI